jgi:hypothetical protein
MQKPMQTLADFKRRAKPGAQFLRRFLGQAVQPRIVTVAYAQSNAVVFPPTGTDPTPEVLARIADNPQRHGSWFWFPKAGRCRFEAGEMIVLDSEGRPFIAFKPVSSAEAQTASAAQTGQQAA